MEPTTLLIAATAAQAIGAISSANSQASQYQSQAQASEYNAKVSRQQADQALAVSTAQQIQQRREARQVLGRQRAQMAESGVGFTGSAGDVLERSETLAELDALNLAYEGMLKARSYTTQAELDDFYARSYQSSAKNVKRAGYLQAAGSVAQGAFMYSQMKPPTTPKTTVSGGSGFGLRAPSTVRYGTFRYG